MFQKFGYSVKWRQKTQKALKKEKKNFQLKLLFIYLFGFA